MAETTRRRSDARSRLDISDAPRGMVPGAEPLTNQAGSDEVARRAYEFYDYRGGEQGHDWDDCLQAEREVRQGASRAR